MQDVIRDLTMAVRGAIRRPGYSLAVIATLAIGIGANTAIFSIFNWILFRPLPAVQRPHELVTARFETPGFAGSYFVSFRDYLDLRDTLTSTVSGVAASARRRMEMDLGHTTSPVSAEVVTSNYLSVLGAHPQLGRDFGVEEEAPGGPLSAIISNAIWRRVYNANPAALGTTITLNGRSFTIVGVAAPGFQGQSIMDPADVWLPISSYTALLPPAARATFLNRQAPLFLDMIMRLRPGISLAQAQAEATAAMTSLPDFANRS